MLTTAEATWKCAVPKLSLNTFNWAICKNVITLHFDVWEPGAMFKKEEK